jgi:DNA-binding response OmpR family regulator
LEDIPIILVIEDDTPIQTVVEDALSDGGFEPAIAPSGEEAVTLLKGHKGNYRALVTDITLRGKWKAGRLPSRRERSTQNFQLSTSRAEEPTNGRRTAYPTACF